MKGACGADALPLLAFTLQRLFLDYAPEQTFTKAHYDAMGGIEGSIDRKLAEAKTKAGVAGTRRPRSRITQPVRTSFSFKPYTGLPHARFLRRLTSLILFSADRSSTKSSSNCSSA